MDKIIKAGLLIFGFTFLTISFIALMIYSIFLTIAEVRKSTDSLLHPENSTMVQSKEPYTIRGSITCPTCRDKKCIEKVDLVTYIFQMPKGSQKEKIIAGPTFVMGEQLLGGQYSTDFQFNNVYIDSSSQKSKVSIIGVMRNTSDNNCYYEIKSTSPEFNFSEDQSNVYINALEITPH